MIGLEEFYYKQLRLIPPKDRYVAILELDGVLVVNFDCLFNRDYAIRGTDQLVYLLHKVGKDKRFLFISEDGAVLSMSGALAIIENIVSCFNLNKDTCAVFCREDIVSDNITVIKQNSIPFWCLTIYPIIKDIPLAQGNFKKKFAVWFNRGTFYRLMTVKHLQDNFPEESFISYQEKGMLSEQKLIEYFADEIIWADSNTPIVYDQLFPNRVFTNEMIVGAGRKPYEDYFMEIVVETDTITTWWITEKTVKNLYVGKPFIVMAGYKALDKIRSLGFKTFSPWIDESYNEIENNYQRFEAIKQEINRLGALRSQDLANMYQNLLPILEHNRQHFLNFLTI